MNVNEEKDTRPIMVSIRCITYNHEKYIRDALEGFVMQKTNFRFEAIVHDDASTDGTAAIIREYAEKYPDIIKPIYETENQYSKHDGSLARIMNEACKGKYIALCEGDDYWTDPYKLQKQVDFLETHPGYVMCSHSFKDYIQKTKTFGNLNPENLNESITYDLNYYISRKTWVTQPLTCMYLRSAYDENEYVKYNNAKDLTLFFLILKKGKGYFMKDCMALYRIHNGGVWSGSSMNKRLLDDLNTLKSIYDVDRSLEAATFIKYSLITGCCWFTPAFIFTNIRLMIKIWVIIFKYFGFETFKMVWREFHIRKYLLSNSQD